MEFFDYADWRAEGRRKAKAKGNPDLETERVFLRVSIDEVLIYYYVELQTTWFQTVVAKFDEREFSTRFFNMLEVEGQV